MKAAAIGLLAVLFAVGLLVGRTVNHGDGSWAGYLVVATSAAAFGGVAAWTAATSARRSRSGFPSPGVSVAELVVSLMAPETTSRFGVWLSGSENAGRVADGLALAWLEARTALRDEAVVAPVRAVATERFAELDLATPMGVLMEQFAAAGGDRALVDFIAAHAHDWLVAHPEAVGRAVSREVPAWYPHFLEDILANRIQRDLVRVAAAVRDDPEHKYRLALETYLRSSVWKLKHDPDIRGRVTASKARLLERREARRRFVIDWTAVRVAFTGAAEVSAADVRARRLESIRGFGAHLANDERLQARIDGLVSDLTRLLTGVDAGSGVPPTTEPTVD